MSCSHSLEKQVVQHPPEDHFEAIVVVVVVVVFNSRHHTLLVLLLAVTLREIWSGWVDLTVDRMQSVPAVADGRMVIIV